MWKSLLIQRTLPLSSSYLLLILAGIALDYLLHSAGMVWIGRYLGIVGTLFFAISFGYSARKKKLITSRPLKWFLKFHCYTGWLGTLMIIVHSGVHFNAILPWAASALMLIVTGSGHIGQHLIKKLKDEMNAKLKQLGINSSADAEIEQEHYWDSVTVKALEQWRGVHAPMVNLLIALTTIHILSILFLWNWR
jgi:hypothetical protein